MLHHYTFVWPHPSQVYGGAIELICHQFLHLYLSYSMPSLKTFLNQSDRIVSQPDYRDVPYPDFMELRHTMALDRGATPWLYRSMPDHEFRVWCHDLGLMPFNLFTLNTIM